MSRPQRLGDIIQLQVEKYMEKIEEAYRQGWRDCALLRKLDETDAWWESHTRQELVDDVEDE